MDESATRDDEVVAKRTAARATRRARGARIGCFRWRVILKKTIQRWALRVFVYAVWMRVRFKPRRFGANAKKAPRRARGR